MVHPERGGEHLVIPGGKDVWFVSVIFLLLFNIELIVGCGENRREGAENCKLYKITHQSHKHKNEIVGRINRRGATVLTTN